MQYSDLVEDIETLGTYVTDGYTRAVLKRAAGAIKGLQQMVDASIPKSDAEIIISEVDKAHPKWIPVKEQLPKYGTPVLAYGSRSGIFVAKYERARTEWDRDYWWKLNSSIHVCNPTHWMPLPMPPAEKT